MLPDTLLSIQPNQTGSFISWLENLGLKNLISRYSLPKLLEWEWLVPQYQVAFPVEYFEEETTENIFEMITEPLKQNDLLHRLLGYGESWQIKNTDNPHWFLHPFCRPNTDYHNFLNQQANSADTNVYYFYHWQAYALIDVIRRANIGVFPIINTPNIEQNIALIARCKIKPSNVLNEPQGWGEFSKPMTWISHYRAFRDALSDIEDRTKRKELYKQGAEELARYLEIDAEILERAIKEQLLKRLVRDWFDANKDYCQWTLRAWSYLQKDIFFAMEWLCTLNGKSFGDYFKKWQFSHNREVYPPLHDILPFEYFEDRQYFLQIFPYYNDKFYTDILPIGEELEILVSHLQKTNKFFDTMLYAFRQLHEHLNAPKQKGSIDFRVKRPLDYFALLSVRVETCFRYALNNDLDDNGIIGDRKTLPNYIEGLARKRNIPLVIDFFEEKQNTKGKKYVKASCYAKQDISSIEKIMNLECDGYDKKDKQLLQACLCCYFARNYFSHHSYLDNELLDFNNKKMAFVLTGIVVSVLTLLS